MMKKILLPLVALAILQFSLGCTSSKNGEEVSDNQELAEDATTETAEADAFGEGEFGDDEFGDFAGEENGEFDVAGEPEANGEGGEAAEVAESTDNTAFDSDPLAGGDALSDENFGLEEESSEALADSSPSEEFSPSDDTMAAGAVSDIVNDEVTEEVPQRRSLNKMLSSPYSKNGVLVNAIYIARPGDTLDSVTSKIYGSTDRLGEIQGLNGHLARRDVVTGDKIYYNSPQRPTDDIKMQTYYEDIGLSPEVYVSQPGDNIRSVGKNLLGDDRSWKEIWATNFDLESKGELAEGTQLRYWTGDSGGMASAPPPTLAQVDEVASPPPPSGPEMADDIPEMPSEASTAAGQVSMDEEPPAFEPPPPPPPPEPVAIQDTPPPPPPPAMPRVQQKTADSGDAMGDMLGDDTLTMAAGAIFILAALAMFIVIRKRKSKKNIEFHTATHTQLD